MFRLIWQSVLGLCVVLSAVGCQHAVYTDYAAFVREPRPEVIGQDYHVGVPDTLAVTVRDGETQRETHHTVGPDGQLWVVGFEPVAAAGMSSAEIARALNEQVTGAVDADGMGAVAVRVSSFASQKVFVFGQVQQDGPQPFHGANTVLDAVAAAQPNPRADTTHIQVLRPSADGEFRRRLTVDFEALTQRGDSTLDVVLAGGDVVYVPPTTLGSVGLAWDQLFGGDQNKNHRNTTGVAVTATNPPPVSESSAVLASEDLDAMREAFEELTAQLDALREEQGRLIDATHELADATRSTPHHHNSFTPPPTDAVVFTTADVPRGGAGESPDPRPEGVRFWGP